MVMAAEEEDVSLSRSRYEVELPGFRFHPTEEELLTFYLKSMVLGNKIRRCCDIIGFLNIYNYDPRDLPGLAKIGEREWYFFVPRDRKHGSGGGGGRPNRTTETGFWKATGSDRKILSTSDPKKLLGLKKTLVFYQGRAPHGTKTNWVMNEYRLPDHKDKDRDKSLGLGSPKDIVLCKIYMKATSLKVLEQRAAMELLQEDSANTRTSSPSPSPPMSSFNSQFEDPQTQSYSSYDNNIMGMGIGMGMGMGIGMLKKESEEDTATAAASTTTLMPSYEKYDCPVKESSNGNGGKGRTRGLMLPGAGAGAGAADLQVQVPNFMDSQSLSHDSFWSQLGSLLENLTPAYLPMC